MNESSYIQLKIADKTLNFLLDLKKKIRHVYILNVISLNSKSFNIFQNSKV